MADQAVEVRYVKSALWRLVHATGASVGIIASPLGGAELGIRFHTEWIDVEKETFRANVDLSTGTMVVTQDAKIVMGPLYKIEEISVSMPTEAAVALIDAILMQFRHFSADQQQKIRERVKNLP